MGIAYIKNKDQIDELVNNVPENVLTGFHLLDIFESMKKISEIRHKVYDSILFNKRFSKTLEITKSITAESTKDEKKKQKIELDLNKFFQDMGAMDCINKL